MYHLFFIHFSIDGHLAPLRGQRSDEHFFPAPQPLPSPDFASLNIHLRTVMYVYATFDRLAALFDVFWLSAIVDENQ